jgi:hypothetical protein
VSSICAYGIGCKYCQHIHDEGKDMEIRCALFKEIIKHNIWACSSFEPRKKRLAKKK